MTDRILAAALDLAHIYRETDGPGISRRTRAALDQLVKAVEAMESAPPAVDPDQPDLFDLEAS